MKRVNEFIKIAHKQEVPKESEKDKAWKHAVKSKGYDQRSSEARADKVRVPYGHGPYKRLKKQAKPHNHDSRSALFQVNYQGGSPVLTKKIMQVSPPDNEQPRSVKMTRSSLEPSSRHTSKLFYADGERIHPALLDMINKRNEFLF
jgi:hypothetical protein